VIDDKELAEIRADAPRLQNGALIVRLLDKIDDLKARLVASDELHFNLRKTAEAARDAAIRETSKMGRELGETQARLDAYIRKYGAAL
jgi:hypothetical protein